MSTGPDPSLRPFPRLSRRALIGTGPILLSLAACTPGDDSDPEVTATAEPTTLPELTQAPPPPTQEPISSPVAGYLDPERWAGRSLVVTSPALGDPLEALNVAFLDAFATATGATVQHRELGRDGIASLTSQVDAGEVVWDVALIPTEDVLPLAQGGYLTAIDYNVVDNASLYPELCFQHGVGARIYSTVIVYSAAEPEAPSGWSDFWNLDLFAGTRSLRRSPVGTLEFALLADGVPMDELYPLDVARAFTSLDRIREATQFYEDGKSPVEFVRTGQAGLASAWNVRTDLPDVQSLVKVQWNGGMLAADSWVIPRGAPNADVAMSFVNFATRAVPTANYTRLEKFGPANKDALPLLRDDIVAMLPNAPAQFGSQFFENWPWWADQRESLTAQFEDWLLNPIASPAAVAGE
jgi:putative spermidine/putrescine transport system substrate-binding protein